MTSKQRAKLRGLANHIDTILQVGKGGIVPTLVVQCADALKARELIKGRALENAPVTPREAAEQLAAEVGAEVVQVVGSKFVLSKRNDEKPVIEL